MALNAHTLSAQYVPVIHKLICEYFPFEECEGEVFLKTYNIMDTYLQNQLGLV